MPDCLSPEQRHNCMSRVHNKNTRIEVQVRKWLFSKGLRYRINVGKLPGKPDIVLAKYKTAIFINGCFWHGHQDCKRATIPQTNEAFWKEKISSNMERDAKNHATLKSMGWRVFVIWECELKKGQFDETMERLYSNLIDI